MEIVLSKNQAGNTAGLRSVPCQVFTSPSIKGLDKGIDFRVKVIIIDCRISKCRI